MTRAAVLVVVPLLLLVAGRWLGPSPGGSGRPPRLWIHLPPALFLLVTGTMALARLEGGWGTWFDLGLYEGFLFAVGRGESSALVFPHLSPILAPLALLTLLPGAIVAPALLALQATAVAASQWLVLRQAARRAPGSLRAVAVVVTLCYPYWYLATINFRLEPFWLFFTTIAVVGLLEECPRRFTVGAVLAMMVKTHLIVPIVILAALAGFQRRWRRLALPIVLLGGALLLAEYLWWRPAAQDLVEGRVLPVPLAELIGGEDWGIATLDYWILLGTLLIATAGLALERPLLLAAAAPAFLYMVLPVRSAYLQLESHYAASTLPFLMGAVLAAATDRERRAAPVPLAPLLPALLALHVLCAPSPFSQRFWRDDVVAYGRHAYLAPHDRRARARLIDATVPPGDGVSVENDVVAWTLHSGRRIRVFPEGTVGPEPLRWAVLTPAAGAQWVLDRHDPPAYRRHLDALLERGYRRVEQGHGLEIYHLPGD